MPLISIVIPLYNSGKYLNRCLDSVKRQTMRDFEVICVDDGSTDNSSSIVSEYCDHDNRFQLFSQPNTGVSSARNKGLLHAQGKYVTFVDSDDYINPYYLEKLVNNLSESDQMVCTGYYTVYPDGRNDCNRLFSCKQRMTRLETLNYVVSDIRYGGYLWNKIFKTAIIKEHSIHFDPDVKMCEDMLFCCSYANYINSSIYIPDPLYYYVQSENNTIKNKNILSEHTSCRALKKIVSIAQDYKDSHFYITAVNRYIDELFFIITDPTVNHDKKEIDIELKKYHDYFSKRDKIAYFSYKILPSPLWNEITKFYRKSNG